MTTYSIAAEENYDAATVALINGGSFNNLYTDQAYPGYGYDRVNRVIRYGMADNATSPETNSTGYILWSGQTKITVGANYDGTSFGNHAILSRPIGLPSSVTKNSCFNLANVIPSGLGSRLSIATFTLNSGGSGYVNGTYTFVPLNVSGTSQYVFMSCAVSGGVVSGISIVVSYKATVGDVLTVNNSQLGGTGSGFQLTVLTVATVSDGTWRRVTEFDNTNVRNGDYFVDPNTGNLWMHALTAGSDPCIVYLLRKSASYAQEISPLFPFDGIDRHMVVSGETNNYAYTFQYPNATGGATYLVGSPRDIQSAETTVDYKLPYFWFQNPVDTNSRNAGYFLSAPCFSTNNKVYQLASVNTGSRNYALYRFDEPSAATPYNLGTTGGGFTTITPWTASTGPNTNISAYTTATSQGTRMRLWYLPATNNLVALTTAYPQDKTSGKQSDFFMDCTYVGSPDGAATFDYHASFVTGFVDINFNPLSASGTNVAPANSAYAVIDVQDINPYLNVSSFLYTDANAATDYVKRWLAFTVLKCNPGDTIVPPANVLTSNSSYFMVFVAYSLVSGSAPVPVTVVVGLTIPETGWDTQLPLNSDFGGLPTGNAVAQLVDNTNASQAVSGDYYSDGIWDAPTSAFWFSGQAPQMWGVSMTFLPREPIGGDKFDPSPPFLRLGVSALPPPSYRIVTGEWIGRP